MPYFAIVRERGAAWNWSVPMRRQAEWKAHADFMDRLADEGFILAGGPLGTEDEAPRVLHVVAASEKQEVEAKMAADPWTLMGLLRTVSLDPWTVLLGRLG